MDGIQGLHPDDQPVQDSFMFEGVMYRLIACDDRRAHYEAQPEPKLPEAWQPLAE